METQQALSRWKALASGPDDAWTLEEAALLYAAPEYPRLVVDEELGKLDEIAEAARDALGPAGMASADAAAQLCAHLFERAGFLGNREAYTDPRNSYLNEVIERRLGIPISLSAIGLSIGRRLGIPLEGVGMPGHFLIASTRDCNYFDPFGGGVPLTPAECRARFRSIYGDIPWTDRYLDPTPRRGILARMLSNLKLHYLNRSDLPRARRILEFLLVIAPQSRRDRELLAQIHEWQARLN